MNDDNTDNTPELLWHFAQLIRSGAASITDLPEDVQAAVERVLSATRHMLANGLQSKLAERKAAGLKPNGQWKDQ